MNTKVHLSERVGYTAGAIGMQVFTGVVGSYFLLFLTDVLYINALAAGSIFLVARFVDACTDPIMASIADRTHTRIGAYRPWIFAAALPQAIVFILMFTVPTYVSKANYLVWGYCIYIFFSAIWTTMGGVNYGSLNSVMSKDRLERSKFGSCRAAGENISTLITGAVVMPLILLFGNGKINAVGFNRMVLVCAFVAFTCYFLCASLVRERVKLTKEKVSLKESIKVLKNNKPLYAMIICVFGFIMSQVFFMIMLAYYSIHYLGNPALISPFNLVIGIAGIVILPFVPILHKVVEKKHVLIGSLIVAIGGVLLFTMANKNLAIMYIGLSLYGLGSGCVLTSCWGMIPEASDYGQWKNGTAAPGLAYAVVMFSLKVGVGLASFLSGALLSAAGYDGSLKVQSAGTLGAIRSYIGIVPIILLVIAVMGTMLYNLNRERLAQIDTDLDARNAAKAAQA